MRTTKQKNKKPAIIITLVIALLVVAGGASYAYTSHLFGWGHVANEATYQAATDEQTAAGKDTKANTTAGDGKASSSGSDQPPAPTPSQSGKSVVEISIPTQSQDTQYLRIRFQISASVATGQCTLTLSKTGSSPVIKTAAPFQSGSQISTCQGFDILKSELSAGTWSIDLVFENTELYGHVVGGVAIN